MAHGDPAQADHARLTILRATGLLDSPPEAAFERLTRLASGLVGAPVALVSLVDERRQFFKSALGLKEPWATRRETPLTHSFCQYVVRDRATLAVDDARQHPVLRDNLAIRDLGVIAYAGVPLVVCGEAVGALCVVDDKPRRWTEAEVHLLEDLAASVIAEIELRLAVVRAREQSALVDAVMEGLGDAVLAVDASRTLLVVNAAARRIFPDVEPGRTLPPDWSVARHATRPGGAPLAPEDGPLRQALRGMSVDDLVFSILDEATRRPVWLAANGRPLRDAGGALLGAVATVRDVTEVRRRNDVYRALARNIPGGAVLLFDHDLRCVAVDGELVRGPDFDLGAAVGRTMRELGAPNTDATLDLVDAACRRTLAGESVVLDVPRGEQTLSLSTTPVRDDAGRVQAGLVLALDVSRERAVEAALRRNEAVYRAVVQHLPNGAVFMVDCSLRFVAADGPLLEEVLGRIGLTTLAGRTVADTSSDGHREANVALYERTLAGERVHAEFVRAGKAYEVYSAPIREGDAVTHALVAFYDVTQQRARLKEIEIARSALERYAAELREASNTDELTGLLNRRGFRLLATQEMNVASRQRQELLVVFIDLDGMKAINDELGHEMGDRALVDTAKLLRRVFRKTDLIARLGGDEFVVLATRSTDTTGIPLMGRLRDAVAQHAASAPPFRLSLSVGTATFDPSVPASLDELVAEADQAMYDAKTRRKKAATRTKLG